MAANLQSRGLVNLGKRFFNQTLAGTSHSPLLITLRRGVHVSVYEKNVEEQVRPAVVPDNAIEAESDMYWAPDPQTGVFGPGSENNTATTGFRSSSTKEEGEYSVSEQKIFFRPLEDLDKPQIP